MMCFKTLLLLCHLVYLAGVCSAAPACDDSVSIVVSATATNLAITSGFGVSTLLAMNTSTYIHFVGSLPTASITGTFTVTGRYCEPEVYNASRHSTIQLLVHGAGYTRDYWSGAGLPGSTQQVNGTTYSWVDYASQQGYPTFSVDRLCNGQSSRPDGLAVCQLPMNVEVLHQVVLGLRVGSIGGRSFSKVIYVGHSIGSLIGNIHAQRYPTDVDGYVLTGFSSALANGVVGAIGLYFPVPNLLGGSLDVAYLASSSRSGFEQIFYYSRYTEDMVDTDFNRRGTLTMGEVMTFPLGQLQASKYNGLVYVLTGQEDLVFCATSEASPMLGSKGDCGQGSDSKSAQVQQLYPRATSFGWAQPADTGHDLNFHETAWASFASAHKFLALNGF